MHGTSPRCGLKYREPRPTPLPPGGPRVSMGTRGLCADSSSVTFIQSDAIAQFSPTYMVMAYSCDTILELLELAKAAYVGKC